MINRLYTRHKYNHCSHPVRLHTPTPIRHITASHTSIRTHTYTHPQSIGRVWRKVPESDARSVWLAACQYCFSSQIWIQLFCSCFLSFYFLFFVLYIYFFRYFFCFVWFLYVVVVLKYERKSDRNSRKVNMVLNFYRNLRHSTHTK